MNSLRSDILRAVADVLLDIAAAWFASLLISPVFIDVTTPSAMKTLLINGIAGIVSLGVAIKLRRLAHTF